MKKLLFFCLQFGCFALFSCNNGSSNKKIDASDSIAKKNAQTTAVDTCQLENITLDIDPCEKAGSGNLIIDPALARRLIGNFSQYQAGNPNLQPVYWVDKCAIIALDNFFKNNKEYDGAWVTFSANESAQYKSSIYFVATQIVAPGSNHIPDWPAVGKILIPGGCSSADCFSLLSNARNRISDFRNHYRKDNTPQPIDRLSKKVWVNSCVFDALAQIIALYETATIPLDGVSIFSAAYSLPDLPASPPTGLLDNNQSTIVMVPTYSCPNNDQHFPAWQITQTLFNKFVLQSKKVKDRLSVYNHGELCPNACDPNDF